ncbi:zinc-ribbon domain-containing protein [Clostridium uliginosum]|uniref:Zinc-ribbon domain-containing protein n=1 Tax=Clostridium uliginosum TaxID=119641 RepID=A0A1I1JQK9_9CLOT|nr:zinc ribbon domain-containing protein [Clostridium uliginosum]SFC48153.1 zinc-ribbon domain-containing protein [Clostridium uliginosum]
MYCTQCGKEIKEGVSYCENCGIKIDNNDANSSINQDKNIEVYKSKKNKNVLAIVIVAVLIIALGGGGFAYVKHSKIVTSTNVVENNKNETLQDNTSEEITSKSTESKKTPVYHGEKEVYAKLLKNRNWLIKNAEYDKSPDYIRFLILDVNKDGISEMLLYHEGNAGLAGITLSVISYDSDSNKIRKRDINTSHGGYRGYLDSDNTIVTSFSHMGHSMLIGWKIQGDEYVKSFNSDDDLGRHAEEDLSQVQYLINDKSVSKEKYNDYISSVNNNLTYTEMYELNDYNIRNVLGVEPSNIENEDYIPYAASTQ